MPPFRRLPASSLSRVLASSSPRATHTFRSTHFSTPARPAFSFRTYATSSPVNAAEHKAADAGASHADHGHEGHHEDHYDPPGGWLWGIRPGDKYEKEGWENIMIWGYCGSTVVAVIAYVNKEDTT